MLANYDKTELESAPLNKIQGTKVCSSCHQNRKGGSLVFFFEEDGTDLFLSA